MKLAICKTTSKGRIVTDSEAEMMAEGNRIVDVKRTSTSVVGDHYVDVWGGTWLVEPTGESRCTVGSMDRWA